MNPAIKLKFSEKYDQQHATQYLLKHQDGLARRLSHKRDVQLARKALALAGEPGSVLDLPSGAGRFGRCWPKNLIVKSLVLTIRRPCLMWPGSPSLLRW